MLTFVRILPGSITDVSAMSKTIDMTRIERCVIVADKGFSPSDNIRKLENKYLSYIIPLRRNSSLIPEPDHFYSGENTQFSTGGYTGNLSSTRNVKMMFTCLRRKRIFF